MWHDGSGGWRTRAAAVAALAALARNARVGRAMRDAAGRLCRGPAGRDRGRAGRGLAGCDIPRPLPILSPPARRCQRPPRRAGPSSASASDLVPARRRRRRRILPFRPRLAAAAAMAHGRSRGAASPRACSATSLVGFAIGNEHLFRTSRDSRPSSESAIHELLDPPAALFTTTRSPRHDHLGRIRPARRRGRGRCCGSRSPCRSRSILLHRRPGLVVHAAAAADPAQPSACRRVAAKLNDGQRAGALDHFARNARDARPRLREANAPLMREMWDEMAKPTPDAQKVAGLADRALEQSPRLSAPDVGRSR